MIRRLVPAALRRRYALKFGLVLLVIALSVGAIGLVETAMVADSVEERVLADQRQSAVEEAAALERWNDRNDQLLLSAAQAPVFGGEENESEVETYLADVYGELPDNARTNALYVDTETGEVLAGLVTTPIHSREWRSRTARNSTTISRSTWSSARMPTRCPTRRRWRSITERSDPTTSASMGMIERSSSRSISPSARARCRLRPARGRQ